MKKINLLIISMFLFVFLLFSVNAHIAMSSEGKDRLFKEALTLYKADSQYAEARFKNQWKTIYSFQHPNYKKAISFEEFQYFDGHVLSNYREDKTFQRNTSGVPIYPSLKDIKKDPRRKDPFLGIPLPPTYRFIPNPMIRVTKYKIEKVYVDDSGTLGKVAVRLKITEDLPIKDPIKARRDTLYIDHWEKIDGKWVLAITKPHLRHISGSALQITEHPVPVDASRWSAAHFTEFKPEELNSISQRKLK